MDIFYDSKNLDDILQLYNLDRHLQLKYDSAATYKQFISYQHHNTTTSNDNQQHLKHRINIRIIINTYSA
jgi:hypothetical protein